MSCACFHIFTFFFPSLTSLPACFSHYTPKVYYKYVNKLNVLYNKHSHLKKLFKNSIFSTLTFSCSSHIITLEHVNSTNVLYGLCAICAFGSYNPIEGRHIILFNLGLIQFSPGSIRLILSGTTCYGKVSIKSHEIRQSFTQYCPSGLLQWVAYGFKAVKSCTANIKHHFEEMYNQHCAEKLG